MIKSGGVLLVLLFGILLVGCKEPTKGMQQIELGMNIINTVEVYDNSVELVMISDFSSSFSVQKTSDPYIVVIEVPGVGLGDTVPRIVPDSEGIEELRFSMAQTPMMFSRIEIVMKEPMDVVPEKVGKVLVINLLPLGEALAEQENKPLEVAATVDESGQEVMELLPATEITALGFKSAEEEVRLTVFSDGAMAPDIFTLPDRIIIDVPGVLMKSPLPEEIPFPVKGVRYGAYKDKVRLVLDMHEERDFIAVTSDNTIIVAIRVKERKVVGLDDEEVNIQDKFGNPDGEITDVAQGMDIPADTVVAAPSVAVEPDVKPDVEPDVEPDMDAIEDEELAEGQLPDSDVNDPEFGALREDEKRAKGFTELGELESAEDAYKKKYKGKLISLDFQDADIVPIFRFLAEIGSYNVVIHPLVTGKITLKLMDVPWDHALDIILELSNLGKSIEGNILRIAPASIFVKQKQDELALKGATQKAAELLQVAIHLKHIAATDMLIRLNEASAVKKKEGGVGDDRGTIRIDERTNTILVNDTADNIRRIRDVEIPYWDTPEHGTMQVLIEAKIVSVRTDYTHNLGIRWGGSATNDNFSFIDDKASIDFSVNTPVQAAGPGAAAAGGLLNIGYADTFNLNLSLSALETVKKAKSLSNPRVITIDKQEAMISKGTAIPYATSSDGGGTTIETEDATLSLTVTPEIQPNGIVKLKVLVTNDSPTVIPGADAPGIDTQQIQTTALVKNAETLVLGGIFTSTEEESEIRVPLLNKIPVLGWLFKTRSVSRIPNELLIFITPRIIE